MTDAGIYFSAALVWLMFCVGLCYPGSKMEKALATVALTVFMVLACLAAMASSSHVA